MAHDLARISVLITGAGSGIGKAAALRFAAAGSKLFLLGRNEAKLIDVQQEIAVSYPNVEVAIASVDVTDKQAIDGAVKTAVEKFGGLTVVVANGTESVYIKHLPVHTAVFRHVHHLNWTLTPDYS